MVGRLFWGWDVPPAHQPPAPSVESILRLTSGHFCNVFFSPRVVKSSPHSSPFARVLSFLFLRPGCDLRHGLCVRFIVDGCHTRPRHMLEACPGRLHRSLAQVANSCSGAHSVANLCEQGDQTLDDGARMAVDQPRRSFSRSMRSAPLSAGFFLL